MKTKMFIGTDNNEEEWYIILGDEPNGWSLSSYCPRTEDDMRANARETTPEDLGYETKGIERWFDYDKFAEDMEEDWYETNDIDFEYEKNGETIYLCNPSGQGLIDYFSKKEIRTYEDFTELFCEEAGLTEKQFDELMKFINMYRLDEEWNKEKFREFANSCKEYPEGVDENENNDN